MTDPGRPRSASILLATASCGLAVIVAAAAASRPVAAVFVAAGVPFLLLTSIRTKVLVYFAVLPLIGWFEVHYPDGSFGAVPSFLAAVAVVHVGWELLTGRERLPAAHPYVLLVGLFAVLIVIQSRNPIIVDAGAGIGATRAYLVPLGLFFVGLRALRRPEDVRALLRVVVITALISGLYMLKQFFFGFDDAERTYWEARGNTYVIEERKLFSTAVAPDVFGFVSAYFVLACVAARSMSVWPRLAMWTAAICSVGVVASGLRIALFALVVGGGLLLGMLLADPRTRTGAVRLALMGTASLVVLVALVIVTPAPQDRLLTQGASTPWDAALQKLALLKHGTEDDDYRSRADRVPQFLEYMERHPWGAGPGVGDLLSFNTFTDVGQTKPNLPEYVINTPFIFQHDFFYFDVGVELGAIGLAIFVALLVAGVVLALDGWHRTRGSPELRVFLALAASSVVLVSVHNLTNVAFHTAPVAAHVWFLLAAPIGLLPSDRTDQATANAASQRSVNRQ